MKDKFGMTIKVGQSVLTPEPDDSDNYNHEFVGTVDGFRGEYVQVSDGDGDVFDIEPERLTIQEDDMAVELEPEIDGVKFGTIVLEIEGDFVDDNEDVLFDYGSLAMSRDGRDFIIDVTKTWRDYDEESNITSLCASATVDLETFPKGTNSDDGEYQYNLTKEDVLATDLKTEYFACPAEGEGTVKLIRCYMEVEVDGTNHEIPVTVDVDWTEQK